MEGEDTPVEQRRMYKELVQDMSVPMSEKLRVFVASFFSRPKKKKRKAKASDSKDN